MQPAKPQLVTARADDPDAIKAEFDRIMGLYDKGIRQSYNALVIGDVGTGKTFSLRTARKPLLIHSFDPGGCRGLDDLRSDPKNGIIIDNRFEVEDAANPTAYRLWEEEFNRLEKSGILNHLGTYVIDSATFYSDALMNAILKANSKSPDAIKVKLGKAEASVPSDRDYQIQIRTMAQEMGKLCGLPFDFILLAHTRELVVTDRETKRERIEKIQPLVTVRLRKQLPALFDEVYYTQVKTGGSTTPTTYHWQTEKDNLREAKSRLSSGGKLDRLEPQDFKALLKKVGRDTSDMPTL